MRNEEWECLDKEMDLLFEEALRDATSAIGVANPPRRSLRKSVSWRCSSDVAGEEVTPEERPAGFDLPNSGVLQRSLGVNMGALPPDNGLHVRRPPSGVAKGVDASENPSGRKSTTVLLAPDAVDETSGKPFSSNDVREARTATLFPPAFRRRGGLSFGKKSRKISVTSSDPSVVNDASFRRRASAGSMRSNAAVIWKRRRSMDSNSSGEEEVEDVQTPGESMNLVNCIGFVNSQNWDKVREYLSANEGKRCLWDIRGSECRDDCWHVTANAGNIFHLLCRKRPPQDVVERLLSSCRRSERAPSNPSPATARPTPPSADVPSDHAISHEDERRTWSEALEERDESGRTPVHVAAANGCSLETMKALIHAHPPAASMCDGDGRTPLTLAMMWYFHPAGLDCVEIEDVSRLSIDVATLLEIVRLLKSTMILHPGAKGVHDADDDGCSPYDYAKKGDADETILESLKSSGREDHDLLLHLGREETRRPSEDMYNERGLRIDYDCEDDFLDDPWESESLAEARNLIRMAAKQVEEDIECCIEIPPIEEIHVCLRNETLQKNDGTSSFCSYGDGISEVSR